MIVKKESQESKVITGIAAMKWFLAEDTIWQMKEDVLSYPVHGDSKEKDNVLVLMAT